VNILSVDTSTKNLGIGILASGDRLFAHRSEEEGHSSPLFPKIEKALGEVSLRADEIDLLAVVSGPGSFTGLRIGMAGLFGWAAARELPLQPVSVFEAIEAQLEVHSTALIVVHSRGTEFYTMLVRGGKAVGPKVCGLREALKLVDRECEVCGPGATELLRQAEEMDGDLPRLSADYLLSCDMIMVCRLAESKYRSDPAAADRLEIEPFYMTLSQAQINFERSAGKADHQ